MAAVSACPRRRRLSRGACGRASQAARGANVSPWTIGRTANVTSFRKSRAPCKSNVVASVLNPAEEVQDPAIGVSEHVSRSGMIRGDCSASSAASQSCGGLTARANYDTAYVDTLYHAFRGLSTARPGGVRWQAECLLPLREGQIRGSSRFTRLAAPCCPQALRGESTKS